MEDQLRSKISTLIDQAENRSNKIARVSERTTPIAEILAGCAIAGVLAYSGYNAILNQQPPGAMFAFITALLLAYDPARRLARLQVGLERALVNARMIYEVLDIEPNQGDAPDAKALTAGPGEIDFKDVRFSYSDIAPVLHGVSFTAKAGETTAIVGASQQPYLFEGTIADNIRYGRPDATQEEIIKAAELANAHEFILQQPQGYDTPVGENGVTLSGGQRQRLSIARAIVRNAPVLLLDEATSALDNESEKRVQQALDHIMQERTTIVIAHRLSTVVNADRIVVMEAGHVVEEGRHNDLITIPNGVYARFYQLQSGKDDILIGNTVTEEKSNG